MERRAGGRARLFAQLSLRCDAALSALLLSEACFTLRATSDCVLGPVNGHCVVACDEGPIDLSHGRSPEASSGVNQASVSEECLRKIRFLCSRPSEEIRFVSAATLQHRYNAFTYKFPQS